MIAFCANGGGHHPCPSQHDIRGPCPREAIDVQPEGSDIAAAVVTSHIPCAKAGALPSWQGGTPLVTSWFRPCLQKEEPLQGGGVMFAFFHFWKMITYILWNLFFKSPDTMVVWSPARYLLK